LPTPRAITRTRFEVRRSKIKVTRLINAETEIVSPTNFKLGKRLEHAYPLPWPAIKACEVGLLHVGGGIPCWPYSAPIQLVVTISIMSLKIM